MRAPRRVAPRPGRTGVRELFEQLRVQRWDDHRYYHHSRMNQSLHLLSAVSFVCSYVVVFRDPAAAAMLGWLVSMTSRQLGHFVFEPRCYDHVNRATHAHKEAIKVGYNLRRKVVLMSVWAASPLLLLAEPTLFGLCRAPDGIRGLLHHIGDLWLCLALGGLLFRVGQLALQQDWRVGLVWATKIVTDPFHDIRLYYRAPLALLRGDRIDRGLAGIGLHREPGEDAEVTG